MIESHKGVDRRRQIDVAVQLFDANGYSDDWFVANGVKSVRKDNASFVRVVGFYETEITA